MPINGPELPVIFTSRISAFLMLAKEIPLAQDTGHVDQGEAVQRLVGMDAGDVGEDGAILHANVGELEVLEGRDAFVAGHRALILNAAAENVDAQEPARQCRRRPGRRQRCLQ